MCVQGLHSLSSLVPKTKTQLINYLFMYKKHFCAAFQGNYENTSNRIIKHLKQMQILPLFYNLLRHRAHQNETPFCALVAENYNARFSIIAIQNNVIV